MAHNYMVTYCIVISTLISHWYYKILGLMPMFVHIVLLHVYASMTITSNINKIRTWTHKLRINSNAKVKYIASRMIINIHLNQIKLDSYICWRIKNYMFAVWTDAWARWNMNFSMTPDTNMHHAVWTSWWNLVYLGDISRWTFQYLQLNMR